MSSNRMKNLLNIFPKVTALAVQPTARAVTSSAAREPTPAADTPEVEEEVTVELESRVVRESTQIVTIQSDNEDDDVLYLDATMDLTTESAVERVGGPGLGYVRDSPTSSPPTSSLRFH